MIRYLILLAFVLPLVACDALPFAEDDSDADDWVAHVESWERSSDEWHFQPIVIGTWSDTINVDENTYEVQPCTARVLLQGLPVWGWTIDVADGDTVATGVIGPDEPQPHDSFNSDAMLLAEFTLECVGTLAEGRHNRGGLGWSGLPTLDGNEVSFDDHFLSNLEMAPPHPLPGLSPSDYMAVYVEPVSLGESFDLRVHVSYTDWYWNQDTGEPVMNKSRSAMLEVPYGKTEYTEERSGEF